jgi:hypothetical protein
VDDIVTRLRGQACPECGLPSTHNQFDEAADEIEKLRKELEIYKDLYAREAVERVEQNTPIVAPKGSVLVLKLQDNQHPYLQSELAEITNQMKLKLGVDVIMIQGWDVAGFWEKENANG